MTQGLEKLNSEEDLLKKVAMKLKMLDALQ